MSRKRITITLTPKQCELVIRGLYYGYIDRDSLSDSYQDKFNPDAWSRERKQFKRLADSIREVRSNVIRQRDAQQPPEVR